MTKINRCKRQVTLTREIRSLSMIDQLEEVSARFQAINDQLMRPDLSPKDLMELNKERSQMEPIVTKYDVLKSNMQERDDNELLLDDDDDEDDSDSHSDRDVDEGVRR